MTSSSALCVLGEVRLISSASTIWLMIAPGRYCSSPLCRLGMVKPVMSDGVMSGVNWMRLKEQDSERASALHSVVLPTPGTSSMRIWPSHSSAVSRSSTASSLPTTARAMFCLSAGTMA